MIAPQIGVHHFKDPLVLSENRLSQLHPVTTPGSSQVPSYLSIHKRRVACPWTGCLFAVSMNRVPRPCVFGKGGYDAADTAAHHGFDEDFVSKLRGVNAVLHAFVLPTLRKVREGWGTQCIFSFQ